MPIVSVGRDKLFEALGLKYTAEQLEKGGAADSEFQDLCFEFGIELDDVTSEKEMLRKELNKGEADIDASEEVLYKIDIPANRYDMLCLEGIARALNIFKERIPNPTYTVQPAAGQRLQQMVVKPETALVRPFVVCAVLRGVKFTPTTYNSFIDLQDKLHQNLCRQRTLVAIGTHDLNTLKGPFSYEALPPKEIKFAPLKQTKEFVADELLQYYLENDNKLKKFVPIIKDSLVYPVIYDANRTVLSLPPIINGSHSAITLNTTDVFIECTATDLTKAKIVLNTVCCMFAEYCSTPFQVEPVEVVDCFGERHVYPDLNSREMSVTVKSINQALGLSLTAQELCKLLTRMALASTPAADGESLNVLVPPTRSDVLHAADVIEDVGIAYGYNNIPKRIPPVVTLGKELPLMQLTEHVRSECAMAGFSEILTWALVSREENFRYLRREDDGTTAAVIANPATAEFQLCRTNLLAGILKTMGVNKKEPLPVKLFEVSDVVLLASNKEVGAKNERRMGALYSGKDSGFETIHGLLNRVMEVLGVPLEGSGDPREAKYGGGYSWKPCSDPAFFPGRQAKVYAKGEEVGIFGVIHPEVLENFDITTPCSALELNLEPFCFDQNYKPLV